MDRHGRHRDDAPLDLVVILRTIDGAWPGWEGPAGGGPPAPWGFLVGVEATGGRIVHRALRDHPVRALEGWAAPGRWCIVGVAVRGTARRAVTGVGSAASARVVWVCHRDGRTGSLLGLEGEPATVVVNEADHPGPDDGRVPRLLRQALGGATLP